MALATMCGLLTWILLPIYFIGVRVPYFPCWIHPNTRRIVYICEILYVLTIGFIKASILFFYLRVFPRKSLRVACWGTMVFCGSSTVAFVLATTFQCHPIVYTWDKNIKGGHCVNYNSLAWANAALNIFQDIMILLLPMHELRHLKLNKKKKVGMYAMFGVGGL
jgi:hypothetical protein